MTRLTVIQLLPALDTGGVERGTLEVGAELVRRGHRSIVISAGGELLPELLAGGSEHITLPVGKKSPLTLRLIPRLRALAEQHRATILHARSRLPAWIGWLAWRGMNAATRPRFVTSVHGPYTVNRYSRIMTRGERVIAVSGFIHDYIVHNYPDVPHEHIITIPRGVSPERYPYHYRPDAAWLQNWQQRYPHLAGKTLVTLPGRLTRWKGQQDFLRLFARLNELDDTVHGLIVGGPHPRKQAYFEELKSQVAALGLSSRITFTGHRSDLREIMSISHIVLSLSGEPEAFGRTVLEALCLGIPVIGYAHGGTGEILRAMFPDGMINPHDIDTAAQRVQQFLRARPVVPDQNPFTLQGMLDSTITLYEQLAAGQRGVIR